MLESLRLSMVVAAYPFSVRGLLYVDGTLMGSWLQGSPSLINSVCPRDCSSRFLNDGRALKGRITIKLFKMAQNSASDAVQEFLKDFLKEQMYWEALAHTTQRMCQKKLGSRGIMARFEFRVKTYESLKKKVERCNASRGGYNSKKEIHDDICDRAGVRIVVHAPIQKQKVDIIIRETFEVIKVVQHPVEKVIHSGHIGVGYFPSGYKPV